MILSLLPPVFAQDIPDPPDKVIRPQRSDDSGIGFIIPEPLVKVIKPTPPDRSPAPPDRLPSFPDSASCSKLCSYGRQHELCPPCPH